MDSIPVKRLASLSHFCRILQVGVGDERFLLPNSIQLQRGFSLTKWPKKKLRIRQASPPINSPDPFKIASNLAVAVREGYENAPKSWIFRFPENRTFSKVPASVSLISGAIFDMERPRVYTSGFNQSGLPASELHAHSQTTCVQKKASNQFIQCSVGSMRDVRINSFRFTRRTRSWARRREGGRRLNISVCEKRVTCNVCSVWYDS